MDQPPINRRPLRLASDAKLARWRQDLEAALLTERPPGETLASWQSTYAWVQALVAAIADEQADRGHSAAAQLSRIKRA